MALHFCVCAQGLTDRNKEEKYELITLYLLSIYFNIVSDQNLLCIILYNIVIQWFDGANSELISALVDVFVIIKGNSDLS